MFTYYFEYVHIWNEKLQISKFHWAQILGWTDLKGKKMQNNIYPTIYEN